MSAFQEIDTWTIPDGALDCTRQELRRAGVNGNEGLVLWLGVREGRHAHVRAVVLLRGDGVRERPAHVSMSAELMNEVTDLAIAAGLVLVGQVHSHGPFHGLNLSVVDLAEGVAFPSYVSIVAPNYGAWDRHLASCGVHIFAGGRFRRLDPEEIEGRFQVHDAPCITVIAGE